MKCEICKITEIDVEEDVLIRAPDGESEKSVCKKCFMDNPELLELVCSCGMCQGFKKQILSELAVMEWDK
jgi:hypothetical protein